MATKEKIAKTTDLSYYEGRIPMKYRYTFGLAGEQFFQKLKEGKLVAAPAPDSDLLYCPPRIFCEQSFEPTAGLVEIEPTGTLDSFTVCCEDLHGAPQAPVVIGLVRFDEADGGLAAPLHCEPEDIEIGMPVKLCLKPKKERTGSIGDVWFEPAGE